MVGAVGQLPGDMMCSDESRGQRRNGDGNSAFEARIHEGSEVDDPASYFHPEGQVRIVTADYMLRSDSHLPTAKSPTLKISTSVPSSLSA